MVGGSMAWLPSGKLSHNYNIMPGHENPFRIAQPSTKTASDVQCWCFLYFNLNEMESATESQMINKP